jgi:protocatechuate 3,4-dioxygenase beta subunit
LGTPGIQIQIGGRGGGFDTIAIGAPQNTAQQANNAPVDPEKRIRLEGHVLSAAGEPLRKATVTLLPGNVPNLPNLPAGVSLTQIRFNGAQAQSVSTDENGVFVIDNVTPGTFQLMADRNGFVPQRYGSRNLNSPGTPLTLKEGDRLTKLDIVMTPQAVITGRVLDQDGDPVPNIQVQASRYAFTGGQRQLRTEGVNATTDFRGDYTISGLLPGRYYLRATVQTQQQTPNVTNVTTFFPSSLDLRGSAAVDVGAGAEMAGMTIRLRREKVYSIRGTTISADTGAPISGVSVLLVAPETSLAGNSSPLAGLLNNQVQSDREGKFEIRGVIPGSYTLSGSQGSTMMISAGGAGGGTMVFRTAVAAVRADAPAVPNASGRIPVNVGAEDANVVLPLGVGATITGTVSVEGGSLEEMNKGMSPPRQVVEGIPAAALGPNVRLIPTQGVGVNTPSSAVETNGSFSLTGAAPGVYYIALNGIPDGYYVKSMTFSGQDITRTTLDFSGGGGKLDITLAKGLGEISGMVTDSQGRPLTGVNVSLWPEAPTQANATGGVRTATTDQSGAYKFTSTIPGEYRLAAFEELPDAGLAQYAPFLNGFTSVSSTVKLAANGSQSSQLKPVSRDKIQAEFAKLP